MASEKHPTNNEASSATPPRCSWLPGVGIAAYPPGFIAIAAMAEVMLLVLFGRAVTAGSPEALAVMSEYPPSTGSDQA